MTRILHNRQLPLARKYEDQILREEMRAREKILADQCRAKTAASKARSTRRSVRPIAADVVIHLATRIPKNPGPGAWAATIVTKDGLNQEADWYAHMTQPLLELKAMIAILTAIHEQPGTLAVHTTARWIVTYLNDGTAERWHGRCYRKSTGDPVQHAESWAELLRLCDERKPAVAWVGHNANPEMSRCDELAVCTLGAGNESEGGQ